MPELCIAELMQLACSHLGCPHNEVSPQAPMTPRHSTVARGQVGDSFNFFYLFYSPIVDRIFDKFFSFLTLCKGMPCTQCEVLNVTQYSDPTFGPF